MCSKFSVPLSMYKSQFVCDRGIWCHKDCAAYIDFPCIYCQILTVIVIALPRYFAVMTWLIATSLAARDSGQFSITTQEVLVILTNSDSYLHLSPELSELELLLN